MGLLRLAEAKRVVILVPRQLQHPAVTSMRPRPATFSESLEAVSESSGEAQDHRMLSIDVFEAEAKKIGCARCLAQGTSLRT